MSAGRVGEVAGDDSLALWMRAARPAARGRVSGRLESGIDGLPPDNISATTFYDLNSRSSTGYSSTM